MKHNLAQGLIVGLFFVAIAVILAMVAAYGIMILNVWLTIAGIVGEGAWVIAGKYII